MQAGKAWQLRWRTAQATALLCLARLALRLLPFAWWRATLGRIAVDPAEPVAGAGHCRIDKTARRLAVHVERAAGRLPFDTKCLPRAMALCWLLRRARIGYVLKIAARPAAARAPAAMARSNSAADALHAWVEVDSRTVIGALPGPWLVVLALRG